MGLTAGLEAEEYDRTYSDVELVRRIVAYFRPHWRKVALVALMVSLVSLASTITPIVISRSIDLLGGNPQLQLLLAAAAVVTVLGALGWAFNFVQQRYAARAVGEVVLALREDAFQAVMRRDLSFFDQHAAGRIVSRVTSDTQDFATVVTLTVDLLSQLVLVVVISAVMLNQNVRLALITMTLGPIVIAIALAFRRLARHAMQLAQRSTASVNATIQETISGIAVAKNFRQEAAIYQDFQAINEQAYRVQVRRMMVFGSIFPLLNTVSGVGVAIIVYVGGLMAINQTISVGEWYLFVQGLTIFFYPLTSIASFWSQFQQGLAASERVFALIDDEPQVVQTAQEPVGRLRGAIEFERVTFNYSTGRNTVLEDFELTIPAGETLAIVGHTGAGKSSLVSLLARQYDPQAGAVKLDDIDIRQLDLADLRRAVAVVPQDPVCLAGSIRQNIRLYDESVGDDQVQQAAEFTNAARFIEELPDGYDFEVLPGGANLSQGQRQLLALARALALSPSGVLVLDEATSSIDTATEALIQDALERILRSRTSLVIAHRLSTIRGADRIIVMERGKVVEDGNHESLLALGGFYAQLHEHQAMSPVEGEVAAYEN
ncbi:MAG: ABC transporter ATP-binding protein [Caldilineaceae bacterium]|nr:ABC transporter ATP-binding protein [Caldilineaceae bacterium]